MSPKHYLLDNHTYKYFICLFSFNINMPKYKRHKSLLGYHMFGATSEYEFRQAQLVDIR